MKILFLYMFPLSGNGSASYLHALCKELTRRGHEIAIVAPDKRRIEGIKIYTVNPPQMGVFHGHPELSKVKRFIDMDGKELGDIFVSYLKTSVDAVADFNPEIIHVFHTAFLPPIGRILKLLFGIRIIISTHGSDLQYLSEDRRLTGLIDDANRFAAAITANSIFTKQMYLKMFGKKLERKIKVIPGGVNIEQFVNSPKNIEEINKKFKLHGEKVVLFTGRLIKAKGIEYLIKAAPLIQGKVLIIGDGPHRETLEAEVKKRNIKNVIFGGYVGNKEQIHAYYERADVYVSPTVFEGFGLTIVEAMVAHTPVIASNKGGIVSIIKNGVNGFMVTPRSPQEIADIANKLLDDDALRKKVGDEAYKTVVEKFTWQHITDEYEKLYKEYAFTTPEYLKLVKGDNETATFIKKLLSKPSI